VFQSGEKARQETSFCRAIDKSILQGAMSLTAYQKILPNKVGLGPSRNAQGTQKGKVGAFQGKIKRMVFTGL